MNRFLIVFLLICTFPFVCFANEDYNNALQNYDLSVFEDNLDKTTRGYLEKLNLDKFEYESLQNLSLSDILNLLKEIVLNNVNSPVKTCVFLLAFIIVSAILQSFRIEENTYSQMFSTVISLIISIMLIDKISQTVALSSFAIKLSADFIYGFIPTFCVILVVSGNPTISISTNSMLLLLAQGLNFISSNIFLPTINCFLALGICSSLRYELHLDRLNTNLKQIITKCISFCAAAFVSVLSIKTAVASKADAIGLRSIRFAINSVVPVIGSAVSEGLLSIQSYSSLIKTSVGVVGIIAIILVFLPSLVSVSVWRLSLSICCIIADTFDDRSVSLMLKTFCNTLLLINVLLILSMMTTVISLGILVAVGG